MIFLDFSHYMMHKTIVYTADYYRNVIVLLNIELAYPLLVYLHTFSVRFPGYCTIYDRFYYRVYKINDMTIYYYRVYVL